MNGNDQKTPPGGVAPQDVQGPGDSVPLMDDVTDPKHPTVTLVPRNQVEEAIRRGAKQVSTENYQNSLNKARLQKPSAAPTAPTAPQAGKPVPGAPGVTTTSPGGLTKVPGQTLGAGATGTGPGIPVGSSEQMSQLGGLAKGVGREIGREAYRIFAPGAVGAGRTPQSLMPKTTGPESTGAGLVQFAENWLPLTATEKIGVAATDFLAEHAPKIAEYMKVPVGLVARTLYNVGSEWATAKAQGRDAGQAAETAFAFSAITEPMAMASPLALRALYGVKEQMGKNVGRRMIEMSESPGLSWLKQPTLDKLKGKIGPYNREEFNRRAGVLYQAAQAEVNKVAAQASRNYQKTAIPVGAMLADIEDNIKKVSNKESKGYMRRMLRDVEETVGGFADANLQGALKRREEIEKTIADLNAKIPGQKRMVQQASQQALAIKSQELTDLDKQLRNIPVMATPAKLNQLRRKIGNNWVIWGKAEAEFNEAQRYAKKLYNNISAETDKVLSRVDPSIKGAINDENAMRDIWKGTAKEQHVGIGFHSLGRGGSLPRIGAAVAGYEIGANVGEHIGVGRILGGVGGAALGSKAANPFVTGAARAAHSGAARGLPQALYQTYGEDNYPNQDIRRAAKQVPHPME